MEELQFDPAAFSGRVPIFPLPDVVLLPYAALPLHIFEPRYRAMTEAALAGEGLIAMALLKPGWESDYEGNPPVHSIVGVGKIADHTRLDDGRFNLILVGVARAEIEEVVSPIPYRTARVRLLGERPAEGDDMEEKRLALAQLWSRMVAEKTGRPAPEADLPLGALCDLVASLCRLDAGVRQELLEELDAEARCNRLLELLKSGEAAGRWPPGPSLN